MMASITSLLYEIAAAIWNFTNRGLYWFDLSHKEGELDFSFSLGKVAIVNPITYIKVESVEVSWKLCLKGHHLSVTIFVLLLLCCGILNTDIDWLHISFWKVYNAVNYFRTSRILAVIILNDMQYLKHTKKRACFTNFFFVMFVLMMYASKHDTQR